MYGTRFVAGVDVVTVSLIPGDLYHRTQWSALNNETIFARMLETRTADGWIIRSHVRASNSGGRNVFAISGLSCHHLRQDEALAVVWVKEATNARAGDGPSGHVLVVFVERMMVGRNLRKDLVPF